MSRFPNIKFALCLGFLLILLTGGKRPPLTGGKHPVTPSQVPVNQPLVWTPYTITADQYFHVDDFWGLAPDYNALVGRKSLWCGRRPDPALCWVYAGYPNHTVQVFESRQFSVQGDIRLDFVAKWAMEPGYDFLTVETRTESHDWQVERSISDSGQGVVAVGEGAGSWAQFRIKFVADAEYSPEDGGFYQPYSAIVLDSLSVWVYQAGSEWTLVDHQTFENEAVGATETSDGDWYVAPPYVVNTIMDAPIPLPGSLRAAILACNASPDLNRIVFNLAKGEAINLLSPLPPITDYLIIDGFSQPGAVPNTNPVGSPMNSVLKVALIGNSLGTGEDANGLVFQAPGRVRGLAFSGFQGNAIRVEADWVYIEGNYIGTDINGLAAQADNEAAGVKVTNAEWCHIGGCSNAARNVIGGNVLGVHIDSGANSTFVSGNYIGRGADAVAPLFNREGVRITGTASTSRIGSLSGWGVDSRLDNLIASNSVYGINVSGTTPANHHFYGNRFHQDSKAIEIGDSRDPEASGIAVLSASPELIHGSFFGTPNKGGDIQFYWSDACSGGNQTGYGDNFIGNFRVYAGATGSGLFDWMAPATQNLPPGCWITATITFPQPLNTSELSVCTQFQNTPDGNGIIVNLVDANGSAYGSATYSNVTNTGNTYITHPFTPPAPVSGYAIGNPDDPQIYYNITTDASYTGGIDICLNYDENNIPGPEANLVLLHYDGTMWANVTTSRDLVNNKICGHVTTLSPFVVGAVTTTGVGDKSLPQSFALHANIPNPFNPITTIAYDVPVEGADVNITIYDIGGRRVHELVNEHRAAGAWSVQWNGDDDRGQRVASGIYFYRMRAGDFVATRKMVLLK